MTTTQLLRAHLAARDHQALLDVVEAMREAQREYFRSRDKQCLIEARGLEKVVDEALRLIKETT